MRGSWWPNRTAIYWPPLLWLSTLCLSRSPDAQPEAQGLSFLLSAGFLYHILSATGLWNYWGPPRAPSAGSGFPYHILSATSLDPNSSGAPRAPSALCGLPYHISDLLSWLSYRIVQRPLNRPLNLWNGMFDRHQAKITVMQFRGHSLPVYQSMSVPWDFLPCPISSAKHAYAISTHNCHWNVSLPSGTSPRNDKFGRVEGQNTTKIVTTDFYKMIFIKFFLKVTLSHKMSQCFCGSLEFHLSGLNNQQYVFSTVIPPETSQYPQGSDGSCE